MKRWKDKQWLAGFCLESKGLFTPAQFGSGFLVQNKGNLKGPWCGLQISNVSGAAGQKLWKRSNVKNVLKSHTSITHDRLL